MVNDEGCFGYPLAMTMSLSRPLRPEEAIEPIREVLRTGLKDPEYFALAASIERARGNAPRAGLYRSLAQNMGS